MALRGLVKASDFQKIVDRTSVVNLYRNIVKELPRVMTIYDVDIPVVSARKAIRWHFDKNAHLKDGRYVAASSGLYFVSRSVEMPADLLTSSSLFSLIIISLFHNHMPLVPCPMHNRVIGMLLAKGYMELEETLMQWKQKTHLLRVLEPVELQPKEVLSDREKLIRGVEDWE